MTTTSGISTVEALKGRVEGDLVLGFLRSGHVCTGLTPLIPSGIDAAAAMLARSVVTERCDRVAVALPRGGNSLTGFLALYFALGRMGFGGRASYLPLSGSVALSTRNRELRDIAPRLVLVGERPSNARLSVVRMVPGRPAANGRVTPCAADLVTSERLGGLSPADKHLLLHIPWFRPEVSTNTISVSVIDAPATRPDAWQLTYEWNRRASRRQVWVGELGDANFTEFCDGAGIPLWRFDWETISAVTSEWGEGSGPLTTHALAKRAAPPCFQLRPVDDADLDHELCKLERSFAAIHRKARKFNVDAPPIIKTSRQLFYLLGRVPVALDTYDSVALQTPRVLHAATALKRVRDAPQSQWFGPWRRLDQEWHSIRAGVTAVYDQLRRDNPKYWDILELIERERARAHRRRLVIRCTTKVEKQALTAALLGDGMAEPDELDREGFIDIRWYGALSPALPYGPTSAGTLTIITEPPSPFRAGPYLTAEEGEVEALLYPSQMRRFKSLAERTAVAHSGSGSNTEALRCLDFNVNGDHGLYSVREPEVNSIDPFEHVGRRHIEPVEFGESVERMRDHWEEYIGLGSDRDPTASSDAAEGGAVELGAESTPTSAVLLAFLTGEHVFLPADSRVDVVLQNDRLVPRPATQVRAGQNVVLMEGMERGSALTELFDAWEESYAPGQVYGELYRRALQKAIDNLGGTDQGLADKLGVTPRTVRGWREGDQIAPGDETHLEAILKLSGIESAAQNYAAIRLYVRRVRGKHQSLGRIFNRAVSETVVNPGGPEQRRLEQETGLDLTPILSAVRRLTVAYVVSEPRQVPRSLLGRFLTAEDPAVKGTP